MADFIIDQKAVSFKQIRQQLVDHIESLPDAEQWSLFLQSSGGNALYDYMAAIAAFLKTETILARRETFIQYATSRAAIIGRAQDLGYSAYRGRNAVLKLNITPANSGVLQKFSYVGQVKDKYLVLANDYVVNAGVPVDVEVIVGEVLTETIVSPTLSLYVFRFSQPNVSEDVRIFIETDEVEVGNSVSDALDGKFYLQSNALGSVDAKYLNLDEFDFTYGVGSNIILNWIPLKDVQFVNSDIKFDTATGVMNSIATLSLFEDVETASSIQVNAPFESEAKIFVRGREDQPKVFRGLDPDLLDVQGEDISAAVMRLFLLRDGGLAFSAAEKAALQVKFEKARPFGLQPPVLEDSEASPISLFFVITLKPRSTAVAQDLVDAAILPYKNKLGGTINLADIEELIEDNDGVKIARVRVGADAWDNDTYYQLGAYAQKSVDDGRIYKVTTLRYLSGVSEPAWVTNADNNDNELVWEPVAEDTLTGVPNWTAAQYYAIGDIVKPSVVSGYVFRLKKFRNFSGATEPTWSSTEGARIKDKNILWAVRELEGTPAAWTANTVYEKGDIVKATTGFGTVMFQCVGFMQKSGSVEPTWNTTLAAQNPDASLVWTTFDQQDTNPVNSKKQWFDITTSVTVN